MRISSKLIVERKGESYYPSQVPAADSESALTSYVSPHLVHRIRQKSFSAKPISISFMPSASFLEVMTGFLSCSLISENLSIGPQLKHGKKHIYIEIPKENSSQALFLSYKYPCSRRCHGE